MKGIDMEAIKYYEENYNPLFLYLQQQMKGGYRVVDVINNKVFSPKFTINDSANKCRFCDKSTPDVTFKKIAHTFPESIGNKAFISADNECDTCNELFSKYENDLNVFLNPFLVLNGVPGKRGSKKYKSNDKTSEVTCADNQLNITKTIGSDKVILDEKNKEFEYEFDINKHVPLHIYKILVKMALAILPENQLKDFSIMKDYVLDDSKIGSELCIFVLFPGFNRFEFTVIGYKRKHDTGDKPAYIFAVMNGNIMLQIPIFSDNDISTNNHKEISIDTYPIPTPFDKDCIGDRKFTVFRLGDEEKKSSKLPITFKYESAEYTKYE